MCIKKNLPFTAPPSAISVAFEMSRQSPSQSQLCCITAKHIHNRKPKKKCTPTFLTSWQWQVQTVDQIMNYQRTPRSSRSCELWSVFSAFLLCRSLTSISQPLTSKETPSYRSRHASRHVRHARAVRHGGITNQWWRGKSSRHSRRMRNS